jgi:hypothetical protein
VRVAVEEALGLEPHVLHRAAYARLVLGLSHPLNAQRLGDDRGHPLARVQRLVGVLEDHLNAPAQVA